MIDKAVLAQLRALIVKEHQARQYISVAEGLYWHRRIFVNVANESALPELRRELEDRGMVCFELDGTRISDFWSFGQEAAWVGSWTKMTGRRIFPPSLRIAARSSGDTPTTCSILTPSR